MSDDTMQRLDAWIDEACAALHLDPTVVDRDAVLALAGDAAHAVVRPAAPVTTFLAGFVAGAASADGRDAAQAFRAAVEVVGRALPGPDTTTEAATGDPESR